MGTNVAPSSLTGTNTLAPPPVLGTNVAPSSLTGTNTLAPPPVLGTNVAPSSLTGTNTLAPPPVLGSFNSDIDKKNINFISNNLNNIQLSSMQSTSNINSVASPISEITDNRPLTNCNQFVNPTNKSYSLSKPKYYQATDSEELETWPVYFSNSGRSASVYDHESFPRFPKNTDLPNNDIINSSFPDYIVPVDPSDIHSNARILPGTPAIEEKIGIPFALFIQPLSDKNSIPTADNPETNNQSKEKLIIRCKYCNSYINPYVTFENQGNNWRCCICNVVNIVPSSYYCPLSPDTGLRTDVLSRIELHHATYETIATAEYISRPPQKPIFLFLLDVSHQAVVSGLLKEQCQGILNAIRELPEDDTTCFSFVCFDSTVYLFNFRASQSTFKVIITPDILYDKPKVDENNRMELIQLPAPRDELIVPISECYDQIMLFLEQLPGMFHGQSGTGSAFGPALNAAISIIHDTNGKIVASLANRPSVGEGSLEYRSSMNPPGDTSEYKLLTPTSNWYRDKAIALNQIYISVDIFLSTVTNVEISSIAPLARFTSGHIYAISPVHNNAAVIMKRLILRDTGFESIMKVRASTQHVAFCNSYCHGYHQGSSLIRFPILDADTTYTMQISISNTIPSNFLFFQTALLYTNRDRQRRIRVSTIALGVSSCIPQIINNMDAGITACLLFKQLVEYSFLSSFATAQEKIYKKFISLLKIIKNFIPQKDSTCLILPKSLRYVPQLLLGFFRYPACSVFSSFQVTTDVRIAAISDIFTIDNRNLLYMSFPSVYTIYSKNQTTYPTMILNSKCSSTVFYTDGIMLITTAKTIVIWVGKDVPVHVSQEFGLNLIKDGFSIPLNIENTSEKLRKLLELIKPIHDQLLRPTFQVLVAHQGKGYDKFLFSLMVDDMFDSNKSYGQFLMMLKHSQFSS